MSIWQMTLRSRVGFTCVKVGVEWKLRKWAVQRRREERIDQIKMKRKGREERIEASKPHVD